MDPFAIHVNFRLVQRDELGLRVTQAHSEENPIRLGDYQRLDVRAEKDWAFRRWKLAAYGELLNATNHYNPRYFYTNYNSGSVVTGQGLPITPTAGLAFEF